MTPTKKPAIIRAGAWFTVSTGEYRDYIVWGVFRATQDIDTDAEIDKWLEAHPEQKAPCLFDERTFFADMARRGLVHGVPSYEWHLGSNHMRDRVELIGPEGGA
jgi:hypothetical protein